MLSEQLARLSAQHERENQRAFLAAGGDQILDVDRDEAEPRRRFRVGPLEPRKPPRQVGAGDDHQRLDHWRRSSCRNARLTVTLAHQVRHLPSARQLDLPTLNDHILGLLDEWLRPFNQV